MSQGQKIVTKSGIGPGMHTVHVVLTCCSFGMWAPVWFLHWLIARRRSVAYIPPQPQQPYPYPQQPPQQWPPQP